VTLEEAVRNGDVMAHNVTSRHVHARVREIAQQQTVAAILERLR
jgi:hypothetical protein